MANRFLHQQKFLQKMSLTPQMRQSIRLLSLSTKELNEYIDEAVGANPFLRKELDKKKADRYTNTASSWRNENSYDNSEIASAQVEDERSYLLSQLRMLNLDGESLKIAEHLIYEMDDNGYVTVPLEEIAQDLVVSVEEVDDCLEIIQSLEPAGIGARDIRECLKLQLKRMGRDNSIEYAIASEYLDELAKNDIKKISKSLKAGEEKVRDAIDNIKKLNPRPASTILSKGSEPVIPDLIATIKDKKLHLELNRNWLPRLKFYNPYEDNIEIGSDPEAKEFVKENMTNAKHLVDNLRRREETMCRVAGFILNFHQNEVINDVGEIKSLTIKDVSHALGLHPTTINRTVANKYIQINDMVLPLRNFLSKAVKKDNGETTSTAAIKKRIEALVNIEDKRQPLSDMTIQGKLAQEGIIIKRRTIAKYRNALRILPSHLRKKMG